MLLTDHQLEHSMQQNGCIDEPHKLAPGMQHRQTEKRMYTPEDVQADICHPGSVHLTVSATRETPYLASLLLRCKGRGPDHHMH